MRSSLRIARLSQTRLDLVMLVRAVDLPRIIHPCRDRWKGRTGCRAGCRAGCLQVIAPYQVGLSRGARVLSRSSQHLQVHHHSTRLVTCGALVGAFASPVLLLQALLRPKSCTGVPLPTARWPTARWPELEALLVCHRLTYQWALLSLRAASLSSSILYRRRSAEDRRLRLLGLGEGHLTLRIFSRKERQSGDSWEAWGALVLGSWAGRLAG